MNKYLLVLTYTLICGCGPAIEINCPGTLNVKNMRTPIVFEISSSFSPSEQEGIVNAANNWNRTMDQKLITFESGGYPIIKVSALNGNEQAKASLSWMSGYIRSIEIRVSEAQLAAVDMESLMVHELGHALGLAHAEGGVMDPYLSQYEIRRSIDQASINSVSCLY